MLPSRPTTIAPIAYDRQIRPRHSTELHERDGRLPSRKSCEKFIGQPSKRDPHLLHVPSPVKTKSAAERKGKRGVPAAGKIRKGIGAKLGATIYLAHQTFLP